jgi:hypothetical protein
VKMTKVARSSLRMMAKSTLTSSDGFLTFVGTTSAMVGRSTECVISIDASCPYTTALRSFLVTLEIAPRVYSNST